MELKITQAMTLMLSYIVFCFTVNWTRNVYPVSSSEKLFFGFLLAIGFGVSEGIEYFMDFIIPKIAKKSSSRYIKGMVVVLLSLMVVISTLCISVKFLLRIEASQPFFEAVSEDFVKRYCLVGVPVLYLWSMALGRFMYFLDDATFRSKKRVNDAGLTRSEFILMGLKNMGRVTDAEIHQLRARYDEERRRR
ncbi:uncharacterized protein LOC120264378 [Dioscorea cayenensis subsp. rotundata]|uniref:Uncharacterized protein LOC120264378 n=1 Tax=Dioscorea cayennensis subsp. rotundata TaxID=55577 RepID=A0AB40BME9_DIOCR|nr:uncharacterized protein LOC120264378 [Dioscorea cayenensis subsp. rotundata]